MTSGFTLVLDGDPEEVKRILDAVAREYQKVEEEALRRDDWTFGASPIGCFRTARSSLRGRIDLRYDAHDALEVLRLSPTDGDAIVVALPNRNP